MSELQHIELVSDSSDETEEIATKIGHRLKGNEVIELSADLGGGKTTFTKGLVESISTDQVSSPSFTISNEYRTPGFDIIHFDFYRLSEPGLIADALAEKIEDKNSVVLIEWGDIVTDVLPNKRLTIVFKVLGDNKRQLILSYPEQLKYLVEDF